ncbi:MAG TPA: hypothetical protein VHB77_16010 [Planctomycetaceae bacterium]|nr:hypothetical protein [Planctomycetaceae bacterium]
MRVVPHFHPESPHETPVAPMSDPILISRRTPVAVWIGAVLAGVLCAGLAVYAWTGRGDHGLTIFLASTAAILILAGVGLPAIEIARRRWVAIGTDRFRLIERHQVREYLDSDVICFSVQLKARYREGLLTGRRRKFILWTETDRGAERLQITSVIPAHEDDPLQPLLDRLSAELHRRATEALESGDAVEGVGWSLDRQDLHITDRRGNTSYALEELSAVDVYDGQICVWRTGKDEPIARVPFDSANAHLLILLLRDRLSQTAAHALETGEELGRLLFERRPGPMATLSLAGCSAIVFVIGLYLLPGFLLRRDPAAMAATAIALSIGVLGCAAAWCVRRVVYRFHEHGVRCSGMFASRSLRYADVETFTYSAVRHFHNGQYTGTSVTCVLRPRRESSGKSIRYGAFLRDGDEELTSLRDHIADRIADRLHRELTAGNAVPWLKHVRFVPEGVEYRPLGWFGRKERRVLPFAEVTDVRFDAGRLLVWRRGQSKPVLRESTTQANLFPGARLLLSLIRR